MQIKQIAAASVFLLLNTAYALPNPTTVGDVLNDVKNGTDTVVNNVLNWQLPNITVIENNANQFFNNVKNAFQNAPEQVWEDIRNNTWPQQVENWLNSLPSSLRAEAKTDLIDLANELGNGTTTNTTSTSSTGDASSIRGAVFTVASIAGLVAVFISF